MIWLTLLRNKWVWLAAALVLSNAYTAYKVYQWRDYQQVRENLDAQIRLNELNIETAKRREGEYVLQISKMNAAARENAEQKALDDEALFQYDTVVEDLLHEIDKPDDVCLDAHTTGRLRQQFEAR